MVRVVSELGSALIEELPNLLPGSRDRSEIGRSKELTLL